MYGVSVWGRAPTRLVALAVLLVACSGSLAQSQQRVIVFVDGVEFKYGRFPVVGLHLPLDPGRLHGYLKDEMASRVGFVGARLEQFEWSGQFKDHAEAVQRLVATVQSLRRNGQPVDIVAHSWGTIIARDALTINVLRSNLQP